MKKAQAAMEFLMTYGWAIIVVLVVIAGLSYFGVLSPSKLLPDKCTFQIGINCQDFSVVKDVYELPSIVNPENGQLIQIERINEEPKISSLDFELANNLGEDVFVTRFAVKGNDIDCMYVQFDECADEADSFVKMMYKRLDGKEIKSADFNRKCFSITEFCEYNPVTDDLTASYCLPEQFLHWSDGTLLTQRINDQVTTQRLTLPCTSVPPKGEKTNAVIELEYSRTQSDLKKTMYGELYTTVS